MTKVDIHCKILSQVVQQEALTRLLIEKGVFHRR
jgi:hypothetical protein